MNLIIIHNGILIIIKLFLFSISHSQLIMYIYIYIRGYTLCICLFSYGLCFYNININRAKRVLTPRWSSPIGLPAVRCEIVYRDCYCAEISYKMNSPMGVVGYIALVKCIGSPRTWLNSVCTWRGNRYQWSINEQYSSIIVFSIWLCNRMKFVTITNDNYSHWYIINK